MIEFEHGTTSGSRVLRVDREVTSFGNWETFSPLGYIEEGHHLSQKIHIETFFPQEILRREWMFKLVGTETFTVGKNKASCSIKIEPVGGFSYEYSLEVT